MTDKQVAKQNMMQTTLDTCRKHMALQPVAPAFERAVTELTDLSFRIADAGRLQKSDPVRGATNEKAVSKTRLVDATVVVANGLSAMASETNDARLLAKTAVAKSTLYRAHDQETISTAQAILAEAATHANALADYGIEQEEREQLNEAIEAFKPLITAPRDTIVGNKQNTANVAALIALADEILRERMDKMMTQYKKKMPDFYAEYFNARNTINTAVRHRKNNDENENGKQEA